MAKIPEPRRVWPDQEYQAVIADNERLRSALQELMDYKWFSVEKDNMEFSARVTCFTLEKARAALKE